MEEINFSTQNEIPKRPTFLTVICILTFISSGLGCVSAILTPLFSDLMIEFLKSTPNFDEAAMSQTIILLQAGWGFYLISFVLAAGSLAGAILMWNLKKIGFHFYALSNLGLLFVPMLMLSMPISWEGILLTSSFIALYAVNFKFLK